MDAEILNFVAGVEKDGFIYFSAWEYNAFACMDIETGNVEYLAIFEKEDYSPRLHAAAYMVDDDIWFAPCCAKHIVKVNIQTLEMNYYDYEYKYSMKYSTDGSYQAFTDIVCYRNRLFMVPWSIDAMVIIDFENNNIECVQNFNDIEKCSAEEIYKNAVVFNGKLYFFTYGLDYYEVFNEEKNNVDTYSWPEGRGIKGVPYSLDCAICFVPDGGNCLFFFNPISKSIFKENLPCGDCHFAGVLPLKDEDVFLPFTSEFFLVRNENNRVNKYLPADDWIFSSSLASMFPVKSEDGKKIATITDKTSIIIFREKADDHTVVRMNCSDFYRKYVEMNYEREDFREKCLYGGIISEDILPLTDYIELVQDL